MTKSSQTYVTLNSGYRMPQLGLGTWLSQPHEITDAVETALDIGYLHFDCSPAYLNEKEIGDVFTDYQTKGKIKRDDLYVTSKVWNTYHSYAKCLECIDMSLRDLQLSYLDMCLIHWPTGFQEEGEMFPMRPDGKMYYSDVDYIETWRAMEDALKAGKVKSIGLSNFNIAQMERVMKNGRIPPANLQVEVHPYFSQTELINWCKKNSIVVTAYSPLANPTHIFRKSDSPNLLEDPVLMNTAKKHHKTAAQVALKWAVQRKTVVIPKGTKKINIKQNFDIWDFELTPDEMKSIDNVNKDWRILSLERDSDHKYYPF